MIRRTLGKLPSSFTSFALVGGVGFIVDATVLATLVHGFAWGDYTARLVSFAFAVTTTWALNRTFAFSDQKSASRRAEYSRYFTVQVCGMFINFGVYSLCISLSPTMDEWPVLALVVGSPVALMFNYLGARFYVSTGK